MIALYCYSPRFHALLAAWLSVVIGGAITVLAFLSAHAEKSMSLYALSLMSAVDTSSSVLVIVFWHSHNGQSSLSSQQSKQEQKYTYSIGVMMIIMGLMLLVDSLKTVIYKDITSFTNAFDILGEVISILGTFSGLLLGWYKFFIAKELDSALVYADATSSICAGLASLVALVISEDQSLQWWVDGASGLVVAVYTLYQGAWTMNKSSYKLSAIRAEEMHGTSKYDKFLQTFAVPYQQSSTASFTTIGESFDMSATSSKEPPSAYYATYLTLPGPSPHHSERKGPRLSVMPLSTAASSYINSRGEYNTSISSSRSSSSDVVRYLSAQVGYLWAAVRGESPSQRFFNNHEYYSIDRTEDFHVDEEITFTA